MDIGQEITNHLEWIEGIASLLGKQEITEEELHSVTRHDQCALGQWLGSEASTEFKDLPEYHELVECHEAFHKLAGKLITALQLGNEAEAIASQEKFIAMSQKVIGYLRIIQENSNNGT